MTQKIGRGQRQKLSFGTEDKGQSLFTFSTNVKHSHTPYHGNTPERKTLSCYPIRVCDNVWPFQIFWCTQQALRHPSRHKCCLFDDIAMRTLVTWRCKFILISGNDWPSSFFSKQFNWLQIATVHVGYINFNHALTFNVANSDTGNVILFI